ncbi:hypothetical protein ABE41_016720 [Fictibacillus arsenicus]|uniref:Uncharacterized protein n=1 Tax=Fictibacillus arsenicus TaxID=255247 RepID=A0A1B1Z882_9BACL|nr:hypothetical protein ABE41_016720 [Fictibacillus arsenicus]
MHILLLIIFILAGWKWGDWKNWRKYYPTILFFIIGDLLYNYLLYDYTMWRFHTSFDKFILPNHTLISIAVTFISFPVKVLIYLGHYPENKSKFIQFIYIFAWILFFTLFEFGALNLGILSHHNGWNLIATFFFYIVIFVMLRLHQDRQLLTWVISFGLIIFLCIYFDVPITSMK